MINLDDINNLLAPVQTASPDRDDSKILQFTDDLTEEKVLAKCRKYEGDWKKYSTDYERDLKNSMAAYRDQQITMEGISVKIPEVFTLIETESPHLINSLFAQSDVVDLKPKFVDPDNARSFKVKAFLNNLIKEVCDGEKKAIQIVKNELIYGTSFVKVLWEENYDYDFNPLSGAEVKINSSHANFYLVDPHSIAFDRYNETTEVHNLEWIRERVHLSKDKMKMMRDNGDCAWFEDEDMQETENKGLLARQKNAASETSDNTYYDEYSCTLYDKDPETGRVLDDEYIVWVLSEKKIIKFHKNLQHRKMYCVCRAYETPNEFLGQGEPHKIGAIASHLSYVHSQLGKTIKRVGQTGMIITPDAGISPEQLRMIENGIYFVDNKDGLAPMPTMDAGNVNVLIEATKYLGTLVEDVTGVGKALAGDSVGDITATQASYVYQAASNRLALKLFSLQEDFIKKLAAKIFTLTKQTITEPISFFDTNNNNITLDPEDLEGNYTFIANGSIMQANSALKLAANSELIQQMIQLVGASQNSSTPLDFNGNEMLQKLVAPYAGIPDFSKMVFPRQMMPMAPPPTQMPHVGEIQPKLNQSPMDPSGMGLPAPEAVNPPKMKYLGNKEGAVNTIHSGK